MAAWKTLNSFVLVTVPLFVFMGALLGNTRVNEDMSGGQIKIDYLYVGEVFAMEDQYPALTTGTLDLGTGYTALRMNEKLTFIIAALLCLTFVFTQGYSYLLVGVALFVIGMAWQLMKRRWLKAALHRSTEP